MIKDDDVIAEENRVAMQVVSGEAATNSVLRRSSQVASTVKHPKIEDVDDETNSRRTMVDPTHLDCIRVHNFQKEYDTFCGAPVKAVKQASFALDYGECFALLGVNGAGKSTTFNMIAMQLSLSSGNAELMGHDI